MGAIRSRPPRSHLPLHRRLRADRRSAGRWLVVGLVAFLTARVVTAGLDESSSLARQWKDTTGVLVTTASVRAGAPLAESVALRRWPVSLVPEGALAEVSSLALARVDLPSGTVLSGALVSGDGSADPPHRHTVAIARSPHTPAVHRADRVDLWTVATGRARRSARGAPVVRVSDLAIEVAVAVDEVPAVVEAIAAGDIAVVAAGPDQ